MSVIRVFPLLKKINSEEEIDDDRCNEFCHHYTDQLCNALMNHGISDEGHFRDDLMFLYETLKAIILRSEDKFHPLHETMENFSDDIDDEEDEDEEE